MSSARPELERIFVFDSLQGQVEVDEQGKGTLRDAYSTGYVSHYVQTCERIRYPKFCIIIVCNFSWDMKMSLREVENNAFANFWSVKEVYYGTCGRREATNLLLG